MVKFSFLFVQAFYPRPVYDDDSEVDEEVLKKVIDDVLVSDAITVFQLLQKKGQSKSYQGINNARPKLQRWYGRTLQIANGRLL